MAQDEEDWLPGQALVARDAYGSRFLLAVPFSHEDTPQTPDHWYAWDVDACWLTTVVSAGAFGSAGAALTDWRAAVGATACEAEFSRCGRDLAHWLLDPALRTGPLGEMFQGGEPHRIEMLGELVHDDFLPDEGNAVLRMLPDWVQWCIDQTGLAGDAASHALKAASAQAANPLTEDYTPSNNDHAPFRRPELLRAPAKPHGEPADAGFVRFTGKMLADPGLGEAYAGAAGELVGELVGGQVSFMLQRGDFLIVNQHRCVHGREPLGANQESVPPAARRLLLQVFLRNAGTGLLSS